MYSFPVKDTSVLLESCDLEAGPQPPTQLLVFRPRRALAHPTPVEAGFRLRLVFLLAIASLSLVSIVVISQQLIVRHLAESQGELVIQLDIPNQINTGTKHFQTDLADFVNILRGFSDHK